MKTEYRFATALKELMMNVSSLDDISVTVLAKKCKVNRQTFYYHFHDIYDLLTLIYLNEKIEGVSNVKTAGDLLEAIYKHYLKNKGFVTVTLNSAGKELYTAFLNNVCYQAFMRIVYHSDEDKILPLNSRRKIARFYASGFANTIVFCFSSDSNITLDALKENFEMLSDDFIAKSIKTTIRNRRKHGR